MRLTSSHFCSDRFRLYYHDRSYTSSQNGPLYSRWRIRPRPGRDRDPAGRGPLANRHAGRLCFPFCFDCSSDSPEEEFRQRLISKYLTRPEKQDMIPAAKHRGDCFQPPRRFSRGCPVQPLIDRMNDSASAVCVYMALLSASAIAARNAPLVIVAPLTPSISIPLLAIAFSTSLGSAASPIPGVSFAL